MHAAQFERDRDEHADQHQAPGQVLREQALDERRHQRGLRRRDGCRADAEDLVHVEHRHADDERRGDDANRQTQLLVDRRGADDVAGLQILRRVAGIGGADADDGADRNARPAHTHRRSSRARRKSRT